MTGIDVALAAAASAAIMSVFVRRWSRAGQRHRIPLAWGLALILVSVLVGVWKLPTENAPTGEPDSIGVVTPIEGASGEGNGLNVGLGLDIDDCGDRPKVTFVANGTAEYWRSQAARFPASAPFQVALPGTNLENVRVGVSDDATDVQNPTRAELQEQSFLRDVALTERDGFTIASGTIHKWAEHLNSIVVQFEPDWVDHRSIGTCYVRLPALTGGLTVLAAQVARGELREPTKDETSISSERADVVAPYDPKLETTFASATLVVDDGDILGEESRPGPDETFEGHPAWVCETHPPKSGEIDEDQSGPAPDILSGTSTGGAAYSREYTRDTRGTDCDGIAVVTESSAGTKRDLLLLGLGAIVSLGAAIIVETILGPAGLISRERRPRPPRRERRRRRRPRRRRGRD